MSNLKKYFTPIASTIGFLALSNLISVNAASAVSVTFSNGSFESDYSSWTTTGDATIQQAFQEINPSGSNQALITTACPISTVFSPPNGECYDSGNTSLPRNDDSPATSSFNKSAQDQISASVETPALQNFLGLSPNALSIPREGGSITGTRTPKEGSAIKQILNVAEGGRLQLTFNWNYLTNDGAFEELGDQDFAFLSLQRAGEIDFFEVLADSTDTAPTLTSSSTDYGVAGGYQSYSRFFDVTPGQYVLGFGVVDVDGTDRSSALLVDDVEVPFEFPPSLGLGVMIAIFGADRLRRNFKNRVVAK